MTFKERWNLAAWSNLTPIGRLGLIIIAISIFLSPLKLSIISTGSGLDIFLSFILFWLLSAIGIFLGLLVLYGLLLIVTWILIGTFDIEALDNVIEGVFIFIATAYLVVFGNYDNKYDFLMEKK